MKRNPNLLKRERGVSMVETAMVLPLFFTFLFGITELTLYLFTRNVVQYAAFMASRSVVVYGDKNLSSIDYPYVGSSSETNENQIIAEAAAEKIIFESLPWEHSRIRELKPNDAIQRVYFDDKGSNGAVRLKILSSAGQNASVELLYCMPMHFNLHKYFLPTGFSQPCSNIKAPKGKSYPGIPIIEKVDIRIKG